MDGGSWVHVPQKPKPAGEGPPPDPWFDALPEGWLELNVPSVPGRVRREALDYAIERLRDWHEAGGSSSARKLRTERGWQATLRNGLRAGWVLEGFSVEAAKQAQRDAWKAKQPPPPPDPVITPSVQAQFKKMGLDVPLTDGWREKIGPEALEDTL